MASVDGAPCGRCGQCVDYTDWWAPR